MQSASGTLFASKCWNLPEPWHSQFQVHSIQWFHFALVVCLHWLQPCWKYFYGFQVLHFRYKNLKRSCRSLMIVSFFFKRSFNSSFWTFNSSISSMSFMFSSCECKCWKSSDLKGFFVRLNASDDRLEVGNEAELPLKNWILSLTGDDVLNTEEILT